MNTSRPVRIALALVVVATVASCSEDEPAPPVDEAEAPTTLVYVDQTDLVSYDLESGETEVLANDLPSADVAVAPDGERYAVVKETSPRGPGPEGFRDPVLLISELGGEPIAIGPGRSPAWSPDGEQVAAVVKAEGYQICTEKAGCFTGDRVRVYDADAGPTQDGITALGANKWTIVGWMQDHVLGLGADGDVTLGEPGDTFDEVEELPLSPNEVWGVSPVERTVLVVKANGAHFFRSDESGSPADEGPEVLLDGLRLGDGAWSPDGASIVVALVRGSGSRLVRVNVATGETTDVPGGGAAHGNVVWAPDASAFAYVRVDRAKRTQLQAVYCIAELECDPLFSWKEGVQLLSLF